MSLIDGLTYSPAMCWALKHRVSVFGSRTYRLQGPGSNRWPWYHQSHSCQMTNGLSVFMRGNFHLKISPTGRRVQESVQTPSLLPSASQTLSLTHYNVCMHDMCLWAGWWLMSCGCVRHLALLLNVCHFLPTLLPGKPATESSGTKSNRCTTVSAEYSKDFVQICLLWRQTQVRKANLSSTHTKGNQ